MDFGRSPMMFEQRQYRIDPKLQLAAFLAQSGANKPATTPLGALDKVASMALSGFMQGQVADEQKKRQDEYATTMRNALAAGMGTPETPDAPGPNVDGSAGYTAPARPGDMSALARILSGNPDTAGMGLQMTLQDAAQRKAMEREDALYGRNRADAIADREAAFVDRMTLADKQADIQREIARINAGTRVEPLEQVMGPNGPILLPRSQAVGMAPYDARNAHAAPPSGNDRRAIGDALGVPVAEVDPLSGLAPRVAEAAGKEQAKQTEKDLAGLREAVAAGRATQADLNRFDALMNVQETGGIYGVPGIGGLARSIGGVFDPQVSEMNAIADKITPTMRQPGSGATSDFDARMFQSATVGVGKPKEANAAIIRAAQAAQKLQEEALSFKEAYATANGGSLRGADEQWRRYLEANPIFDPESPDKPKLNTKRVSYQQFFRAPSQFTAAPAATPVDYRSRYGLE